MKLKGILIVLAVFVTLLFTGCPIGGIDVTGSWSGPLIIEGEGGFTLSADLDQSGSDIGGTAGISYSGIPVASYDVDATIDGNDIEGDLLGSDEYTYDIEITATVNDAGDEMDGDFTIINPNIAPNYDTGTFEMSKD